MHVKSSSCTVPNRRPDETLIQVQQQHPQVLHLLLRLGKRMMGLSCNASLVRLPSRAPQTITAIAMDHQCGSRATRTPIRTGILSSPLINACICLRMSLVGSFSQNSTPMVTSIHGQQQVIQSGLADDLEGKQRKKLHFMLPA